MVTTTRRKFRPQPKSRFRSEEKAYFKALEDGYYEDRMRRPGTPSEIFTAPADLACTWAVPCDENGNEVEEVVIVGAEKPVEKPEVGTMLSEPKTPSEGPKTTVQQFKESEKAAQESEDVEVL